MVGCFCVNGLFRRHEFQRASNGVGLGQIFGFFAICSFVAIGNAHKSQVSDLDNTFVIAEKIGRFDITMNETTGMNIRHGTRGLKGAIDGFSHRKRPTFSNQSGKIGPVHEFHGQKVAERSFVGIVSGNHAGVAASGARFCFTLKPQNAISGTYQLLFQNLQRHFTFHSSVPGLVDGAHATGAEFVENNVVAHDQFCRSPFARCLCLKGCQITALDEQICDFGRVERCRCAIDGGKSLFQIVNTNNVQGKQVLNDGQVRNLHDVILMEFSAIKPENRALMSVCSASPRTGPLIAALRHRRHYYRSKLSVDQGTDLRSHPLE